MWADVQAQIVHSILYLEAAAFEGIAKKPLNLAHEIEKHGNTNISIKFKDVIALKERGDIRITKFAAGNFCAAISLQLVAARSPHPSGWGRARNSCIHPR